MLSPGDFSDLRRWAQFMEAADVDSGRAKITDRRLLVHVARDHVNVITSSIKTADEMRDRRFRPELVWTAALLARSMRAKHAERLEALALEYCEIESLEAGISRFSEPAIALARRSAS